MLPVPRLPDPDDRADHLDRLYRAALVLCGCPHDAEDLVQETFRRLLARPRRVRERPELADLLAELRTTYRNRDRERERRPRGADACGADLDAQPDAPARAVLGHLGALPPSLGAAIMAVDVVGLSAGEAATSLDIDGRTLQRDLRRARVAVARHVVGDAWAAGPAGA